MLDMAVSGTHLSHGIPSGPRHAVRGVGRGGGDAPARLSPGSPCEDRPLARMHRVYPRRLAYRSGERTRGGVPRSPVRTIPIWPLHTRLAVSYTAGVPCVSNREGCVHLVHTQQTHVSHRARHTESTGKIRQEGETHSHPPRPPVSARPPRSPEHSAPPRL